MRAVIIIIIVDGLSRVVIVDGCSRALSCPLSRASSGLMDCLSGKRRVVTDLDLFQSTRDYARFFFVFVFVCCALG